MYHVRSIVLDDFKSHLVRKAHRDDMTNAMFHVACCAGCLPLSDCVFIILQLRKAHRGDKTNAKFLVACCADIIQCILTMLRIYSARYMAYTRFLFLRHSQTNT